MLLNNVDRLRVGWLNGSGRGAVRAEDAQGIPTQSHISPSMLAYEEIQGDSCSWLSRAQVSCTVKQFRGGFKNTYFAEMCSGSEEGSYLRLIDFSITQL